MIRRGGTSKGGYFLGSDLPSDPVERNDLLLRIMGSPDPRQIDGIGGAHPLTSKVAIVAPGDDSADLSYTFLQVGVGDTTIGDRQTCGNLLAGIGPFAIERGLLPTTASTRAIRIRMENTGTVAVASFPTSIDGDVDVRLEFEDIAGASCGSLLPTGNPVDTVNGVPCTLIDNGMPVVVAQARDFGVSGYEDCSTLESDRTLRTRLEELRLACGPLMNLGDVSSTTVPKLTLVAEPQAGGSVSTRTFIPHRCHQAIGVLGAASVATAMLLPDSSIATVAALNEGSNRIRLEHPTGFLDCEISASTDDAGELTVTSSAVFRSTRKIMDGYVFARNEISCPI